MSLFLEDPRLSLDELLPHLWQGTIHMAKAWTYGVSALSRRYDFVKAAIIPSSY